MSETARPDALPAHQRVVATKGPAVGRITGMNHLVMYTHDMDECVRFYRDLLGLKVVRTVGWFRSNPQSLNMAAPMASGRPDEAAPQDRGVDVRARQVFFQLGNGDLLSFYEIEGMETPQASIVSFLWPPTAAPAPRHPQKLDHLALNVRSKADLQWFREHLMVHGVKVSDVLERSASANNLFVMSIYFSDPSNNPLDIATLDLDDPVWQGYDFNQWYRDEDPAPSLLR